MELASFSGVRCVLRHQSTAVISKLYRASTTSALPFRYRAPSPFLELVSLVGGRIQLATKGCIAWWKNEHAAFCCVERGIFCSSAHVFGNPDFSGMTTSLRLSCSFAFSEHRVATLLLLYTHEIHGSTFAQNAPTRMHAVTMPMLHPPRNCRPLRRPPLRPRANSRSLMLKLCT